MYKEDDAAILVLPELQLGIKPQHSWPDTYANLRASQMNISFADGFELGNDVLIFPDIPGFKSLWIASEGILMVTAVPGFEFTDNTADDYEDGVIEIVDVTQFIDSVSATATLGTFSNALRELRFKSSGPAGSRTLQLEAQELVTRDVVSLLVEIQVWKGSPRMYDLCSCSSSAK